jgi:hypothetical protein
MILLKNKSALYKAKKFQKISINATSDLKQLKFSKKQSNFSPMFHARMKSLANCFPNVYLTQKEFIMDNQGIVFCYELRSKMIIFDKFRSQY